MAYIVNFDALDAFNASISTRANNWQTALEELSTSTKALIESGNMSGSGADAVKTYLSTVHSTIQGLIGTLLYLHVSNCRLYKQDYMQNVDTALHANIKETELSSIENSLIYYKGSAVDVDENVKYILRGISDIFSVSYNDITWVSDAHQSAIDYLSGLDDQIKTLESTHKASDFINTDEMITSLTAMINEMLTKDRSYKSDFSPESLAGSEAFRSVYDAYVNVEQELNEKSEAIETSIDLENKRVSELQEEYEEYLERQEKAEKAKWIVTGICVIGSVVAIAATGGAATPLVVGAVSAASSATMAATNYMADHYVATGGLSGMDLGELGKDVFVGAVTGFVTGYVGASIGGAITSGLSKTSIGSGLLHSTNTAVRIGTNAAIGAASEVGSGIVSRGAATFVTTGDLGKSFSEAFDGKSILTDAALGGTSGAVDGIVQTKQAQDAADASAAKYNETHKPMQDAEASGLKGVKETKNHGVDFSESDHILKADDGQVMEVKIKSTGNRTKDYEAAEKALKEQGYDIDFKSMRTGQDKTHVWHHLDDYNVTTNETTLQFIEIDAHRAVGNHSGSANQYHKAHGYGYSKQGFDPNYKGFNYMEYGSVGINTTMDRVENMGSTSGASPVYRSRSAAYTAGRPAAFDVFERPSFAY